MDKKVTNPVEREIMAQVNKLGMYLGVFLVALGTLSLWVFIAWNLALPPLGVRPLSFPQAVGFTLFLALFVGAGYALKETGDNTTK